MTKKPTHPTEHISFLQNLEISLIVMIFLLILGMIALHFVGTWQYQRRKRRWKRDRISVVVDEQEGGDARYLVTIVTRSDYSGATTATTTLHLIGGVFPGRIHDIPRCKSANPYPLFAPLCRERIVLREDTDLDPIIGLVIKTNHVGSHPTWNCRYIIVRNVDTDDAWHFNMKNEVGFGRCVEATESRNLVSLSHAFSQRLLQECKHGQHVIFAPYFYEPTSAYSMYQRICVMVISHLCLVSFTLLSLCVTLPIGQGMYARAVAGNITKSGSNIGGTFRVSLEDETAMSVWFLIIWPSALLAALITTVLGFVMNLHFRERDIYETGFSEMDYAVATALRDISTQRRDLYLKFKKVGENSQEDTRKSVSKTSVINTAKLDESGIQKDNIPFAVLRKLSPRRARDRQRHLFIGGKYLQDPRYTPYLDLPPLDEVVGDIPNISYNNLGERSPIKVVTPATDVSMSVRESESLLENIKGLYKKHTLSIPDLKSPNYSRLAIGTSSSCRLQEKFQLLPGELDPRKFQRSFFKPVIAWMISGGVLLIAALTFLIMGPIGATATVEAELFVLIFITTYLMAWLNLCFVFETSKISLIAFFYAYNDWKLYQLIKQRCIIPQDLGFQYNL